MADLQSWHFKRDIPFKCWWHNTTIKLQGGRKFPEVEKPGGLHLKKNAARYLSLQELRSRQGYVTVVVNTCWFCTANNQHLCLGQGGSPWGWIAKELTQRPEWLCPLSPWPQLGFHRSQRTWVPGPAWKNRQMVDHLRDGHPWLLAVVACFRFIPWK